MLIRPTVAQVTADEPDTAAIIPQPNTLICSNRPGQRETQGAMPKKRLEDRPDLVKISPIQINKGKAVNAQLQLESHIVAAMICPGSREVKYKNVKKLAQSIDKAIQTPLPSKIKSEITSTIDARAMFSMMLLPHIHINDNIIIWFFI